MIDTLRLRIKNSRIGLGMAALGRPGYMTLTHDTDLPDKSKNAMRNHAFDMLDLAWENGVRYFDVARSYGDGEKFLAGWLNDRKIDKDQVVVGSKWGYVYVAHWQVDVETHEIKYHTIENLNKQWDESREILGEYLNIYHIHSATLKSGVLENKAILDRLYEISREGVVIGLSLTGPEQAEVLKKALSVKYDGQQLFQSVQATWNILETSVADSLKEASGNNWFVILKEVMANGRIASGNDSNLSGQQLDRIGRLQHKYQLSADQLAMGAALQQEYADIILSGAAKESHLLSNLKALQISEHINPDNELVEDPSRYWKTRGDLAWI